MGCHGEKDGPHVPECRLQPYRETLKEGVEREREAQQRRSEGGVDEQIQREMLVVVAVLMLMPSFVVLLDLSVCCGLGCLCQTLLSEQRTPLIVRVDRDI